MRRTPRTIKGSRSRRCTARCWTSPPTPQTITSSERWRRPNACELYDHTAINEAIARANGHRGAGRLTKAIASDPQWMRSELEIRMRKLAREHGLPQPECNTSLDAPDHPGLEADFYFPTHHLVVETDGWDTHKTRHAFEDDRAKDAALTAAGYTVLRFTWRQLRDDPHTVADRLKAVLSYSAASASRKASSSGSSIE